MFTPVLKSTGERLRFDSEGPRLDSLPALFTDAKTGRVFRITAKPCGLDCRKGDGCDAWAEEVTSQASTPEPHTLVAPTLIWPDWFAALDQLCRDLFGNSWDGLGMEEIDARGYHGQGFTPAEAAKHVQDKHDLTDIRARWA